MLTKLLATILILPFFINSSPAADTTMFDRLGILFEAGVAPDPLKMTSHPAKYWDKTWSGRCFSKKAPDTIYGGGYSFVPEIDVGKGKYGATALVSPTGESASYYDNVPLERILNGMAWSGLSFNEVYISAQSFLHYQNGLVVEVRLSENYLIQETRIISNGPLDPGVINSRCYYFVPLYGERN